MQFSSLSFIDFEIMRDRSDNGGVTRGVCSVKILATQDKWFGVTYKGDKAHVVQSFKQLIADGVYSEDLYSDLF